MADKEEKTDTSTQDPLEKLGYSEGGTGEGQQKPATSQDSTQETASEEEIPEWLDVGKYGTDVQKATIEQAKAYKESERKMGEAAQKAAQLEREVEYYRSVTGEGQQTQQPSSYGTPSETVGQADQATREKLESAYGMPFEQIKAQYDITNLVLQNQLKPLIENLAETQLNTVQESLVKNDPYFTPEAQKTFTQLIKKYPPELRTKPELIRSCVERAKGLNIGSLVDKAREEGKQATLKQAPAPQKTERVKSGSTPAATSTKVELTEEQKEAYRRWGINPEEL